MPTVDAAGTEWFYAHAPGSMPALILIHGAGSDHLGWPLELRRLPGRYVVAVDLPGHGRSGGEGCQRIDDYAAGLVAFMDRVGLEQAVLVGHSMGGAIAQQVALDAPERVAGLVLLGTGARLPVSEAILEGVQRDFEATVRLIAKWAWGPAADPALVSQGVQAMLDVGPQVLWGDFVACDRFDVRERVAGIAAPALACTGAHDKMTRPQFGEWLAEQIPGARFSLIEGAGHMLMLERPDPVSAAVAAFLDGL